MASISCQIMILTYVGCWIEMKYNVMSPIPVKCFGDIVRISLVLIDWFTYN